MSRFADVDAFSRDPKTFVSSHGTVMEMITAEPDDMEIMIFMDPPEHTRYRRLVSKAFTPRRMKLLEEDIRALCAGLLDGLVGRGSFDYVQDFGARVPAYVIAALLGVPPEDRDMVRGGSTSRSTSIPRRACTTTSLRRPCSAHGLRRQDVGRPPGESARRHVHRPREHGDHGRGRRAAPTDDWSRRSTSPCSSAAPAPRRWPACSAGRR